ncbi:MAG: tetratricopeptide repeat protein [Methylobacter sp.]|nr:tetratricopeptide repeat protein [Methylobacter sp.]
MFKPSLATALLLLLSVCFTAPAFAEEDATMHQVYQAAEAGKFAEAQAMMDKVLRDHPNSAKAHFVEAELLAKQGQLSKAGAELKTAEQLEPGLPFVKPETLQKLQHHLGSGSSKVSQTATAPLSLPNVKDWTPVILMILGMMLIILLVVFLSRRNANQFPGNKYNGNIPGGNIPAAGAPGMGQAASGGMGSGLMGSLATGAALGAGVVAGEALMHHFIDGDKNTAPPEHDNASWTSASNDVADDMGGNDFGIADSSSWDDDSSSDGGDDWS